MNSDKFINVVEQKVIPDMNREFPEDKEILQHDLDPCLTFKKEKTTFQRYKLNVLDWSGNLPDLNPMENLRAITKS